MAHRTCSWGFHGRSGACSRCFVCNSLVLTTSATPAPLALSGAMYTCVLWAGPADPASTCRNIGANNAQVITSEMSSEQLPASSLLLLGFWLPVGSGQTAEAAGSPMRFRTPRTHAAFGVRWKGCVSRIRTALCQGFSLTMQHVGPTRATRVEGCWSKRPIHIPKRQHATGHRGAVTRSNRKIP